MSIYRPSDRQSGSGSFKIEDNDRNGAKVTIVANPNTRVRAPEPAYRTSKDEQFAYQVGGVGRARTGTGWR